jgi:hypothetical protein
MSISRRTALGSVTAFTVTGVTTGFGLAAPALKALTSASGYAHGAAHAAANQPIHKISESAQRMLELLIHRDEAGHSPHQAMISIPSGDSAWYAIDTLDSTKFRMTNHYYRQHGYQLRRISSFKTSAGTSFAACWQYAPKIDWQSGHGMTQAEFDKARQRFEGKGYRTDFLDARDRYAAVWVKGDSSAQQVFSALSVAEYQQQFTTLAGQGYKPSRISGAAVNGATRIAAIFEKATTAPWQAHHEMKPADFAKAIASMNAQSFRMTDASGYMMKGKPHFAGIWEKA